MKVFIIALIFVAVVAAEKKKCTSASDCDEKECCAMSGFFRKGRCRLLSKENGSCSEDKINGVYLNRCPCESGLVCKPMKITKLSEDVEMKVNENCVNETEVTTGDDGEVTIEAE